MQVEEEDKEEVGAKDNKEEGDYVWIKHMD